jgi:NADH-quinone oxidoreductase subunit J
VITTFYTAAAVAVIATLMVITRRHVVHALLYLVVSLLAVAVVFYTLGAPFVAALEMIIYAGAIMVLFLFAIMLLNLGPRTVERESEWTQPGAFLGPAILTAVLLAEFLWMLAGAGMAGGETANVTPEAVGESLFGPYLLGVELASLLLLAGLVGAYHIGRPAGGEDP